MKVKKLLATFLSVCMIIGTMAVPAFAEELPSATDGVITLTEDVTLTDETRISTDTTIDLGGKTLYLDKSFIVTADATVEIKNGTIELSDDFQQSFGAGAIMVGCYDEGNLTLNGVTVIAKDKVMDCGLFNVAQEGNTLTLNNCTVEATGLSGENFAGVFYSGVPGDRGTVVINGGTITADDIDGALFFDNDVDLKDTAIECDVTKPVFRQSSGNVENTTVEVTGIGEGRAVVEDVEGNPYGTITFTDSEVTAPEGTELVKSNNVGSSLVVTDSTSTYAGEPMKEIEGVSQVVAKIGDKAYSSFAEAVEDVTDGETIKLAAGKFNLDTLSTDVSSKTFTIEGVEGTVITYVAVAGSVVNLNLTIKDCEIEVGTIWCGSCLEGSGTYTYDNCTFKIADGKTAGSAIYALNYDGTNPSTVNVKNCEFVGDFGEAAVVVECNGNKISLNETSNIFTNTNNKNIGIWNKNNNLTLNVETENVRNMAHNAVAKIGNTEYSTLADALDKAQNGDTIELISGDTPISAAGTVCGNKTVTITGDAVFDWGENYLFIGRGAEGDGTLIFENANIKSSSKYANTAFGFNISGAEKDESSIQNGTLKIINSTMEVDYMINRNSLEIDSSDITIYSGFRTSGRPANETVSGSDATATTTLTNNSKVTVINENTMGLGEEGYGVLNVDSTSEFYVTDSTFNVNSKGILSSAGTVITKQNAFDEGSQIKITGGEYSFDPTAYIPAELNKQAVPYDNGTRWLVADKWELSATADKDSVYADDEVTVTVKATGADYSGATWVLTYDPTKFEYTGSTEQEDGIESFVAGRIEGFNYDTTGTDKYNNNTTLATYTFKAIAQTSEVAGDFEIAEGTVGTVAMAVTSYPAADVAEADSVTIKLKDFAVKAKLDGDDITGTTCEAPFGSDHTITVETTPTATVYYQVNNGQETTTAPVLTDAGTYTVKYRVDVPAGYDQTTKEWQTITFTISAPAYDVEIADYTDHSKLVLVYSNVANANFKYDNKLMYNVTAAYQKNQTGYVYGYVVPSVKLNDTEFVPDEYYKSNITFVQGNTAEIVSYDKDVNCNNVVDMTDVIYTIGIYNGRSNVDSMVRVLKADVNHSKNVDNADATLVKGAWLNPNN